VLQPPEEPLEVALVIDELLLQSQLHVPQPALADPSLLDEDPK
jgi:hypothetical protein